VRVPLNKCETDLTESAQKRIFPSFFRKFANFITTGEFSKINEAKVIHLDENEEKALEGILNILGLGRPETPTTQTFEC